MALDARRPRHDGRATANERLRDRAIAHAVYLERLKTHETAEAMRFIDEELIPDLVAKLEARLARISERGFDLGVVTTDRLRKMIAAQQQVVQAWTAGLSKALADKAKHIAESEGDWVREAVNAAVGFEVGIILPGPNMLAAAALDAPLDGVLLKDIVARLDASTKNALERSIRISVAEGETVPQAAARVREVMKSTRATAESVARTAIGHISEAARHRVCQENAHLIKGKQWVATLDTRTCQRCGNLDGKVFKLDRGPRPPRHISCRCASVPVLRSWQEMGIDAADITDEQRASMNGLVPASLTYNAWLRRMPAAVQDEALGPTRGALFRKGKLSVSDFVDRQGQSYNLKELRAKEREAFEKAGV